MNYATDHIAKALKNAREVKGLSQRALSGLAGVPQSHISNIENGAVDLRLSSLVELARALDMELTLVPRKSLPAVNAIVRSTKGKPPHPGKHTPAIRKALRRLQVNLDKVLHEYPANIELAQFQRVIRDLRTLDHSTIISEPLRDANKAIDSMIAIEDTDGIHQVLIELKALRNAAAHSAAAATPADTVRPAYALEHDGHGS